jgi:hypothetical protein
MFIITVVINVIIVVRLAADGDVAVERNLREFRVLGF